MPVSKEAEGDLCEISGSPNVMRAMRDQGELVEGGDECSVLLLDNALSFVAVPQPKPCELCVMDNVLDGRDQRASCFYVSPILFTRCRRKPAGNRWIAVTFSAVPDSKLCRAWPKVEQAGSLAVGGGYCGRRVDS